MSLSEIERQLMQADTGDSAVLHEMMVKLVEVVRGQQREINTLKKQMARVHEAVPTAAEVMR